MARGKSWLKAREHGEGSLLGASDEPRRGAEFVRAVDGDVILAAPPQAIARLVDEAVNRHAPEFGNVRKLRSTPMISMDLYSQGDGPGWRRSSSICRIRSSTSVSWTPRKLGVSAETPY